MRKLKGMSVTAQVRYGRRSVVVGRLTDKQNRAMRNQVVTISQQGTGLPLAEVGAARTDAEGYFNYIAPAGSSRTLYATWAGTKTQQDVTAIARLRVPSKVKLLVRPKKVHGKRRFKLSGKVYSAGWVNKKNKLVQLQFWNFQRGKWQSGPALVRTNAKGHFRYYYRIKSLPARAERIRFRAYVPAESSWPYNTGWSGRQTITHYRR